MNDYGKIWKLSKLAIFKKMGKNTFSITFANEADKLRVEAGKPWLFDSNLFVLKELD